jgi:hypothetical protein
MVLLVESHDNIPKIQPKIPRTFAQVKFFRCIILRIKKRFFFVDSRNRFMPVILLPPFGGDKRGGMCYNPHRNANFKKEEK